MRPLFLLLLPAALYSQSPAETLMRDGHFKRARPIVEAQYKERPNDAETLWLMSKMKFAWHDVDAAEQFAEKAVAAAPKDARYRMQLLEVLGDKASHASIFKQMSLGRRFKKELDIASSLDPKNIDALMGQLHFYFQAPGVAGGDKAKGRAAAEEIMRIDPVMGYFAQATVARFDKQPERLEGIYRKAAEVRPANYGAQVALANYLVDAQSGAKLAESESHAREAIKLDPTRIGAYNTLVGIFASQEKWPELDAALAACEKNVPDNLVCYFRAANTLLHNGKDPARAEGYFRKYLTQEPEPNAATHAAAHWRLGLVLEKQGRKPDAIAELQTALKMDPNSPAKADLKRLKSAL